MLRTSEIFLSFQGEAEFTGYATLWVRFFGCNLKCPGFSQPNPKDRSSYISHEIDTTRISSLEDIPEILYGCDSIYSWSPEFKRFTKEWTVNTLVDEIIHIRNKSYAPKWVHPFTNQPLLLGLTGGEPMLYQDFLGDLILSLYQRTGGPETVIIETNATIPLKKDFIWFLKEDRPVRLHFACSPKLFSVSGERNGVRLSVIEDYLFYSDHFDTGLFKFVVNDHPECLDELKECTESIRKLQEKHNRYWPFWIMPVGSTSQQMSQEFLSKLARFGLENGYYIAPRTHIHVFGNKIGT